MEEKVENYQIQQTVTGDFVRAGVPPRVYAKQYDNNMRIIAVDLCSDGLAYAVPDGYSVNIRLLKPGRNTRLQPGIGDKRQHGLYCPYTANAGGAW